jgi:pyruvate,water dikinase
MSNEKESRDKILDSLKERAKELNCLYRVEEILSSIDASLDEVCPKIILAIPPGWQYPDICRAKIVIDETMYQSTDFEPTPWHHSADIVAQDLVAGTISVYYSKEMPAMDEGPFLKEEILLLHTIAERLGLFITHKNMMKLSEEWVLAKDRWKESLHGEWRVVLEMLKQTDRQLYMSLSRKMLNYLSWSGIEEAEKLLRTLISSFGEGQRERVGDWNRPHQKQSLGFPTGFASVIFDFASEHLTDAEILGLLRKWIHEDRLSFLVQVVNRNLSLAEVADAIRRYFYLTQEEPTIVSPSKRGITVSLLRRFLSDQLQYLNVAKDFIEIRDFYHLLQRVIFSSESHGKLGGKSAGLHLAAHILKKKSKDLPLLASVKIPKTWHITSDVLLHFMHYNDFDSVVEQKYKDINQVRIEYPHIVQSFKNGRFPPDILKGLSLALDDFGKRPLIVRSSSLLEDRVGAAFSGKYKSLFLANQGSKRRKLEALTDAVAEVYASTFSPDPIEYRAERGLIDFAEEMGIIIQEVVGSRIGRYYLPAFAGVAFSRNEFRWSPRITRQDGLIRFVPGLGTRAVDRLSDDYPVLIAPGRPGLRANVSPDEIARYSPKKIDVINLETNCFETVELSALLSEVGYEYPAADKIFSIFEEDRLSKPMGTHIDFAAHETVATFDGLTENTPFIKQVETILKTLEETLGMPVDVEFASDGRDFYLLQCRAQSYPPESRPAPIPADIPHESIVFSANRYISNGSVSNITHILYVDPKKYGELPTHSELMEVGRVVGKLNTILPKRQFILMGPGRWGSRGDIKLGVNVTYSDINNTAALIEVAMRTGASVPDLSFGTHFFQDLVEANIRYLPLYPGDEGIVFNEQFLTGAPNILEVLLPDHASLGDTIRLIDVPLSTNGLMLKLLMNADQDRAVAILVPQSAEPETYLETTAAPLHEQPKDTFWRWRYEMVERLSAELDPDRFGVANLYVFGSTKNATAGPGSDIDLIVHFNGTPKQLEELNLWLDGWSKALAEMNYMRTGYTSAGLLDVHIVTDKDIAAKTSFASKIGAVTDPARPLPLKRRTG